METNPSPKVSVAIITYNQREFIAATLESVLGQTYSDFEIVVGDDGSDDGTSEIVDSFYERFPEIVVVVRAARNLGITENCNSVLSACRGEYIAWLGGDDLMYPEKLQRQVSLMDSDPGCSLCFHQLEIVDFATGNWIGYFNTETVKEGDMRKYVSLGCINGGSSTMVRRSSTPKTGYNRLLPVASDWYFWVECLASGGTFRYINESLGVYHRHANNVTKFSAEVSRGEIDSLVSAWLVCRNYPQLRRQAFDYLATRMAFLRHQADYRATLILSLKIKFKFRRFFGLLVYMASKGRCRP